jgi:hypothetical protein
VFANEGIFIASPFEPRMNTARPSRNQMRNAESNANHGCTRMHTDHKDKEDEEKDRNAKVSQGRAKGRKDNEFIREHPYYDPSKSCFPSKIFHAKTQRAKNAKE